MKKEKRLVLCYPSSLSFGHLSVIEENHGTGWQKIIQEEVG